MTFFQVGSRIAYFTNLNVTNLMQVLKLNSKKASGLNVEQVPSCLIMEMAALKEIIEMRPCSKLCGENKVDIWTSSMKGMTSFLESECLKCGHVNKLKSTKNDNFNVAWWTSMLNNGMPMTHFNRFLLDLNFSGISKNGNESAVCFKSKYMTNTRSQTRLKLIRLGYADQKKWLQELIDSEDETVYLSVDGAYPTRGRSSKICFVTLMATVNDVKRVIDTFIVKKDPSYEDDEEPEDNEESEDDNDVGFEETEEENDEDEKEDLPELHDEITVKCSSCQLEGYGVDYMLKNPIRQLLDAGKKVELCCDGDVKIHNMAEGIPNLKVVYDLAHLKVTYSI